MSFPPFTEGRKGGSRLSRATVLLLFFPLLIGPAMAVEFRAEIAYFDYRGGPLTIDENNPAPLPDGCRAQVLLQGDVSDRAYRSKEHEPGTEDRIGLEQAQRQILAEFAVNGAARLRTPGFFLGDAQISGREVPSHPIIVRVWNSADPSRASGYWDSPPYTVLPGFQQVSFLRGEWTFHALGGGVDVFPVEPAGSSGGAVLAERSEMLSANPNPFNSTARISLTVKNAGRVRLRVYDLQGKLIALPVDGPFSAGSYSLVFDGSTLPSGLYFLSLEQESAAPVVRKLVLMR